MIYRMRQAIRKVTKKMIFAGLLGFAAGVLVLAGVRFALFESDTLHYHANFALYVNGEQDLFEDISFYEEVQACTEDELNNPRGRVHMHDMESQIVHVHDYAATWGQFFENLGYGLGNDFVRTDSGVFIDGENESRLTFILNGDTIRSVANRVIEDEDVLLIDYGTDSEAVIAERFEQIPDDAHVHNELDDPAACAGDEEVSLRDRLLYSFGLKQL